MEKNIQDVIKNIQALSTGADPLARQFILNNKPDAEAFKNKYNNTLNADNTNFAYEFAAACGDYTVKFISESDIPSENLKEGIKRFATAALQLNELEFAFSLECLKNKLPLYVPDFAQPTKDGSELTAPIRKIIAETIVNNDDPKCDSSKRDVLIKVITDYDRMQNSAIKPK
jgi:hypothetical protein